MTEGRDGTMWFATPETYWTYDGFVWNEQPNRELVGSAAETLCTAADGAIYAGARWGVQVYREGHWLARFIPMRR